MPHAGHHHRRRPASRAAGQCQLRRRAHDRHRDGRQRRGPGRGVERPVVGARATSSPARPGWQDYSVHRARALTKVDGDGDPALHLGLLGTNGLTAYFGILDVGQPEAGETVVVSAAAGSVGHIVGQIAKIQGCRTVGIAGSDDKCAILTGELGFDTAVNYKAADFRDAFKAATADGIDIYFDNTGGDILGAALRRMKTHGRIVCCGVVSQYDTSDPAPGPRGIPGLLVNNRVRMEGFLVFDFADRYDEARRAMRGWLDTRPAGGPAGRVRGPGVGAAGVRRPPRRGQHRHPDRARRLTGWGPRRTSGGPTMRTPFLHPASSFEELWSEVDFRTSTIPERFNLGRGLRRRPGPGRWALTVVSEGRVVRLLHLRRRQGAVNRLANVLPGSGCGEGDVVGHRQAGVAGDGRGLHGHLPDGGRRPADVVAVRPRRPRGTGSPTARPRP